MIIKTSLRPISILASAAFALLVGSSAAATFHSIPLAWNASPDAGITGYKVYVGAVSRQYTQTLSAGTNLALSVANMEFGKTYYFAVTAIGSTGVESALSTELSVKIAQPPVPVGGGLSVNGSGQTGLNWSYPVSEFSSSPQFIIESSPDLVQWTKVATVLPAAATGGTAQTAQFSWPFAVTGTRKFYRLTAKNWMGSATGL